MWNLSDSPAGLALHGSPWGFGASSTQQPTFSVVGGSLVMQQTTQPEPEPTSTADTEPASPTPTATPSPEATESSSPTTSTTAEPNPSDPQIVVLEGEQFGGITVGLVLLLFFSAANLIASMRRP